MTENTNQNNIYWKKYILNEFQENLNLFAEFELTRYNKTYHEWQIEFTSGYKLTEINKVELLQNVKEVIDINFNDCKYFITTRSKDDSSHYYIVISLIQDNDKTNSSNKVKLN